MTSPEWTRREAQVGAVAVIILLIALGYGGYRYFQLDTAYKAAQSNLRNLSSELANASSTNNQLNDAFVAEKERNDSFANEIGSITGTVGTLTKLANTDPQLLAKYSKVYFLNENYAPASLSDIPSDDVYSDTETYQFLTPVLPQLEDMIKHASSSDVTLWVASSYRSFKEQATLKSEYKTIYGSGANAFSADQGYSEHQLGTTIDFTTEGLHGALDGFDKTDAYTWLTKHAYQYGFILSYPSGNAYYVYEPWHWRYVGVKLATWLHTTNVHFYDVDQRTINTYLVDFYDD
jgi:LAS superfamily LD-carboxypeptidase LdcB